MMYDIMTLCISTLSNNDTLDKNSLDNDIQFNDTWPNSVSIVTLNKTTLR